MLTAFHAAVSAAPPAYIRQAEQICAKRTWFAPETEGRVAQQFGSTIVRVECHRSEDNALTFDRITVFIQAGDGLADAGLLNEIEADTCRPFRGVPCEVSAR